MSNFRRSPLEVPRAVEMGSRVGRVGKERLPAPGGQAVEAVVPGVVKNEIHRSVWTIPYLTRDSTAAQSTFLKKASM
jgi:hypothetical protein